MEVDIVELSRKKMRAVELAKKEAMRSPCMYRHGAVLVGRGGTLVNVCHNKNVFFSFGERLHGFKKPWYMTRHAESAVCFNIPAALTEGASIFVVRINKAGELRNSKPCEMCRDVMKFCGVREVYFSNEAGQIELLKL